MRYEVISGIHMTLVDHTIYFALWLSFGAVHSLLAGERAKRALQPWLGAGYRLAYNGFACVHIALILLAGEVLAGSALSGFDLPFWVAFVLIAVRWSGVVIVLVSLSHYDLGGFSGVRQLVRRARGEAGNEDEVLHVAGLHRYVRHPLYAGAYLCLWGGVNNELALATALWASIYLAIGTGFEERRLIRQYGSLYREYRARVPALIPFTGGRHSPARQH